MKDGEIIARFIQGDSIARIAEDLAREEAIGRILSLGGMTWYDYVLRELREALAEYYSH